MDHKCKTCFPQSYILPPPHIDQSRLYNVFHKVVSGHLPHGPQVKPCFPQSYVWLPPYMDHKCNTVVQSIQSNNFSKLPFTISPHCPQLFYTLIHKAAMNTPLPLQVAIDFRFSWNRNLRFTQSPELERNQTLLLHSLHWAIEYGHFWATNRSQRFPWSHQITKVLTLLPHLLQVAMDLEFFRI